MNQALEYQYYDHTVDQIQTYLLSDLAPLQAQEPIFYQRRGLTPPDAKHIVQILKALSEFDLQVAINAKNAYISDRRHVLIRVNTIGINRADILQSKGRYPLPRNSHPVLGLEITGEILALPKNYEGHLKVGQKIMSLVEGGAYANYALVPLDYCMQIPHHLNAEQAAALPEALMTFWLNWRIFLTPYLTLLKAAQHSERQALQQAQNQQVSPAEAAAKKNDFLEVQSKIKKLLGHQNILVRAASSGIGSLAIIVFASLGLNVYGTCQTLEKADKLRDKFKVYPFKNIQIFAAQDLAKHSEIQQLSFHLIFDMLGGNGLVEAVQLAAPFAQIQHIAFLEKQTSLIDLSVFLRKNLSLKACMLRPQDPEIKAELVSEIEKLLMPCLDFQKAPPLINKTYDFSVVSIHLAHQTMLQNQHIGKCILKHN